MYIYMSIYIGKNSDFEDRLKALETENESLRKYNDYHQVVHEVDHISDLYVDSSFYRQSMKIDSYHKIAEWIDSSVGQSTVIQQLDKKYLHYLAFVTLWPLALRSYGSGPMAPYSCFKKFCKLTRYHIFRFFLDIKW